jgi:GT2 family glycosyltransferase
MTEGNFIGVVTVTYNSQTVLRDFLRCMAEQTHGKFLLFVVDNASRDDTLRILGECSDARLRIIANSDNQGFAAGSNQGIRAALDAGCVSVLLINNDTEFDARLIAHLDKGLYTHQVDMACPKMMYYDEPKRIWAAGGAFQPWLGYRSFHFGEREIDHGQYDRAQLITFVPACCVLIQKVVFERVGLLDERYFVYVEDVDFMYRAMRAGVKLMYLPGAKLLHKVGRLTGGEDSSFAIWYGTRNRIFFLLKHFGLIRTLPWLMVRQLTWMTALASGNKGMDWYRLKNEAFLDGLKLGRRSTLMKTP